MRNKGFTLVELMAVLVVLALLITVAVPSVISISKNIKTEMFCDKVDMILTAAQMYGQDNYDLVKDKVGADGTGTVKVKVSDLVKSNHLKKDNNSCVLENATKACVKDPRDNTGLDTKQITIGIKNKRIYATYPYTAAEKTSCKVS